MIIEAAALLAGVWGVHHLLHRAILRGLRAPRIAAGARSVPCADASFDLALMLKSLHHVPMPSMAQALGEVARVLRPGGHLYVSEPVYAGPLNEVIRLFNEEGTVRAAFKPHARGHEAHFTRPMRVRLLQGRADAP